MAGSCRLMPVPFNGPGRSPGSAPAACGRPLGFGGVLFLAVRIERPRGDRLSSSQDMSTGKTLPISLSSRAQRKPLRANHQRANQIGRLSVQSAAAARPASRTQL
jgi:hypothetical protein